MEKIVVEDLLKRYGLEPDKKTVEVYCKLVQLGFNNNWLRNMCIIKEFDKMYKTDKKVMSIYLDLAITYKNLSIDSIRKVIRDRQLYEV